MIKVYCENQTHMYSISRVTGLAKSYEIGTPCKITMTRVHDFVVDLARAGKTCKEIITIVSAAYPNECLSQSQIYNLIKQVKEGKNVEDKRGRACTRYVRDADFIEAVRADVEADRRITVAQLAEKYDVAGDTIHKVLVDDLGL